MSSHLFDFAVTTIFAREFLEGAIIIGEYRTIVLKSNDTNRSETAETTTKQKEALRTIWISAAVATLFALLVIAAVAITLVLLSSTLNETTSKIIEGISKIVAGLCLLTLSLKIPKFLGIYGSCKKKKRQNGREEEDEESDDHFLKRPDQATVAVGDGSDELPTPHNDLVEDLNDEEVNIPVQENTSSPSSSSKEAIPGLTMNSIRFNVAWNIWREVAECGVFLIPFFLSGENRAIPLSALIGSVVGLALGLGIYWANSRFTNRTWLAVFASLLLVFLSAGLTTGGVHNLEVELGSTKTVWDIKGSFWDIDRLPMTVLKPFGYNDSRTVLEICVYWGWLLLSLVLHIRKYQRAPKLQQNKDDIHGNLATTEHQESADSLDDEGQPAPQEQQKQQSLVAVELGNSSDDVDASLPESQPTEDTSSEESASRS